LLVHKNIPEKYYKKVMTARFFLDYLAALQFLLKGHPANALSVVKARIDFKKQKKNYKNKRKENLEKTVNELPEGILEKSILWKYYVKNQKEFRKIF